MFGVKKDGGAESRVVGDAHGRLLGPLYLWSGGRCKILEALVKELLANGGRKKAMA